MKAKYIVLVLALASVFSACNRDEKNLFDDQAAVRAQKALDNAFDILTAPANGWEMLYFPNTYSAGYSVIVKFNANGKVLAATRNPQTTKGVYKTDDNSTWKVISDYGPILTFDTYNNILHAWADPQSDGDGYLGDYEFLILHADANYVKLKGKKHGAYCILYPLAPGKDWVEYFNEVYQYRDLIVTRNDGAKFNFVSAGHNKVMTLEDGLMVVDKTLEDYYPFVVRANCITFHGDGIPAQGGNALNFKVNSSLTALDCSDNGITAQFTPASTIPEILNAKLDHHIEWNIDKKDMGSTSAKVYNEMTNAISASGGTLRSIHMQRIDSVDENKEKTYTIDRINIEFKGSNGVEQAFFVMGFDLVGSTLVYTYKYIAPEGDNPMYAKEFLQRAGGGAGKESIGEQRLKELLTGTFNVTSASGSTLNAQQLYLTGTDDSNKRLKLSAR